jgi:hypothetical protein
MIGSASAGLRTRAPAVDIFHLVRTFLLVRRRLLSDARQLIGARPARLRAPAPGLDHNPATLLRYRLRDIPESASHFRT